MSKIILCVVLLASVCRASAATHRTGASNAPRLARLQSPRELTIEKGMGHALSAKSQRLDEARRNRRPRVRIEPRGVCHGAFVASGDRPLRRRQTVAPARGFSLPPAF